LIATTLAGESGGVVRDELVDAVGEPLRRDEVVHQPEPVRLGRVDRLAGQDETARRTEADQPGQAERAHRREQAEARGGQPENRVGAADAQVAGQRGEQARAEAVPVQHPDDELVHVLQRRVRTLM
jgi:hypothetical protein